MAASYIFSALCIYAWFFYEFVRYTHALEKLPASLHGFQKKTLQEVRIERINNIRYIVVSIYNIESEIKIIESMYV